MSKQNPKPRKSRRGIGGPLTRPFSLPPMPKVFDSNFMPFREAFRDISSSERKREIEKLRKWVKKDKKHHEVFAHTKHERYDAEKRLDNENELTETVWAVIRSKPQDPRKLKGNAVLQFAVFGSRQAYERWIKNKYRTRWKFKSAKEALSRLEKMHNELEDERKLLSNSAHEAHCLETPAQWRDN